MSNYTAFDTISKSVSQYYSFISQRSNAIDNKQKIKAQQIANIAR